MNKVIAKKYENGLKSIFQKDDFNNICYINIFYPVDMSYELNNKGIGYFTTKMMMKGTTSLSSQEFALKLEENAVFLNISRNNTYINFSLSFENTNFSTAIDIFFDFLMNPRFDKNEIEKLKKEFINALSSRYDDISTSCGDEFLKLIYGDNNYKSWCNLGTKESVSNFNQDDILSFHKKYILDRNPIISILGNLDYKMIEDYFLSKFFQKNSDLLNSSDAIVEHQVNLKNEIKKDFNQAYIMTGMLMPSLLDKNYTALKLINNYLGYGMSSVFFDRIREEMGLVYEIASYCSFYKGQNHWALYLGLDKKNILLALDAIKDEFEKFFKNRFNSQKLDILKTKAINYEIFKSQKKSTRCFNFGVYEVFDLGYNYKDLYLSQVEHITLDEINSSIDILFKNKNMVTSILS